MAKKIDSQGRITSIRLEDQSADPSTPAAGYMNIYLKNGELIFIDENDDLVNVSHREIDYAEATSSVSITATTEGGADHVVSGTSSVAYDGNTPVLIEFYCQSVRPDTGAANRNLIIVLYEDGSSIGRLAYVDMQSSGFHNVPVYSARRLTPSNGNHTYTIKAFVNAGTGTVFAGAGGSGNVMPAFIRITRAE